MLTRHLKLFFHVRSVIHLLMIQGCNRKFIITLCQCMNIARIQFVKCVVVLHTWCKTPSHSFSVEWKKWSVFSPFLLHGLRGLFFGTTGLEDITTIMVVCTIYTVQCKSEPKVKLMLRPQAFQWCKQSLCSCSIKGLTNDACQYRTQAEYRQNGQRCLIHWFSSKVE